MWKLWTFLFEVLFIYEPNLPVDLSICLYFILPLTLSVSLSVIMDLM